MYGEEDTQGPTLQHRGHRETLKMVPEVYSRLGKGPGHAGLCMGRMHSFTNQKLRGREYTERTHPNMAHRQRAEQSGEFRLNPCKSGSLEPKICSSQPEPFTNRLTQPPPVGLQAQQSSQVRPKSFLLHTLPQGKEEKVPVRPFTRHYMLQSS